jgi:spoIIIJ-associated protein
MAEEKNLDSNEINNETKNQDQKPSEAEELLEEIRLTVQDLVTLMGIKVRTQGKILEDGTYYINVRSRRSDGLLIGHKGSTVLAIQALVTQIFKHRYPDRTVNIFIDIAGYRKRQENFLKKKALAVAKIVSETKREMALDILTDKEFQMVEAELQSLGTVRVYTIGTGKKKTVIIAPLE